MRDALLYIKNVVQKSVDEHGLRMDTKAENFIVNFLKEKFKVMGDDEAFLTEEFSRIYRKNVKELEKTLNEACIAYIAKQKIEGRKIVRYS